MSQIELFEGEHIVGVFRGFREGGLEFHAELVLPYRNDFQSSPMHGQFLLVQLESPEEAVLGRITAFSSDGKLSVGSGEEFAIRAMREHRPIPEDLREQYLKYRVNIRVLGVLRSQPTGRLTFLASHRRLPHVGSPVAFPSGTVLREIAGQKVVLPSLEADLVKSLSRAPEPEPVEDEVMDLIATDENIFGVMDVNEEMPGGDPVDESVDIEAAIGAELFGDE